MDGITDKGIASLALLDEELAADNTEMFSPQHDQGDGDDGIDLPLRRAKSDASARSLRGLSVSPPASFGSFEDIIDSQSPMRGISDTVSPLAVSAKDYPDLCLSGRIISASFCLPYHITYTHDEDEPWTKTHRGGLSALRDSFSMLSASSWKHTVIGWTGEITQRRSPKNMTYDEAAVADHPPMSKLDAPVPIAGGPINPQLDPNLRLSRADRIKLEQELATKTGTKMIPVWLHNGLDKDEDVAVFANQLRWRYFAEFEVFSTFHYSVAEPGSGLSKLKLWHDYVRLNKAFADRVLEIYKPGDVVMVHDYQLLLLPAILRERMFDMKINFFLHIPFPSYEYVRCMSRRSELLNGMLGADVIAFQNITFADHFKSCCQRLQLGAKASVGGVEVEGRNVDIQVLPIGINVEATSKITHEDENTAEKVAALETVFAGKKLIVSRDRLDPTRGIAHKLHAFGFFLDKYPEWRDKVILIQITNTVEAEDLVRGSERAAIDVSELVCRINGKHGGLSSTPVRHYTGYLPQDEYFALLRIADLGLITSIRDGMNTASLEYVVAQKNKMSPLILSEFSGASNFLQGSIHINPWDHGGTAKTIHHSLTMPAKARAEMYESLITKLESNTISKWTDKMLRRLLVHLEYCKSTKPRPELDRADLTARFSAAARRLLIFDYDGTLTPIVEDPDTALPSASLLESLERLTSDKRNTVWIVSGRDQEFLKKQFGHLSGLGLSAEHGSFMKHPGQDEWANLAAQEDMSWQEIVLESFKEVTDSLPGSIIERKQVSITWHYRRADGKMATPSAKSLRAKLQRDVAPQYNVEIMAGKANLEVRPILINKGQVVKKLVESFGEGPENAPDFVLCLGDDTTDEDMFRALRRTELPMQQVFSVMIGHGPRPTLAGWRLDEPANVIETLEEMAGME